MKQKYLTPSLDILRLQSASLIATSVPVSGTTDDEARSKSFWGETIFDEEELKEEEETIF